MGLSKVPKVKMLWCSSMKNPDPLSGDIVYVVVKIWETSYQDKKKDSMQSPSTQKLRRPYQAQGASAVAVHGAKLLEQYYSGNADWDRGGSKKL